jgi:hypothetical protein
VIPEVPSRMTDAETTAYITAGGAIVAAVITAYAADLRSVLSGRARANRDLLGKWDCAWTTTYPRRADAITDVVDVQKIRGERITATAHTPVYGGYALTGRVTVSNLVTIHYEGYGERGLLGGVVILQLNATRTEMTGHWYEHTPERSFVGGTVIWRKCKNTLPHPDRLRVPPRGGRGGVARGTHRADAAYAVGRFGLPRGRTGASRASGRLGPRARLLSSPAE